MVETRRSCAEHEDESQRAAKQQKTGQTSLKDMERGDNRPLESQAWLPAPMLNGEPLREDASLRNFNGGIGCHVASTLEEALLLPIDMVELRSIRKNKAFFFFFLISLSLLSFVMLLTFFF